MKKEAIAFAMSALLTAAALAGCGTNGDSDGGGNLGDSYPLQGNNKLKYWVEISTSVTNVAETLGETKFGQELQKETGVTVEYIHPPIGSTAESFNIMLASGDLPDIIEYIWNKYPGGAVKAMGDGYIIKLDNNMEKFAPNLMRYIQQNPEMDKMIKTDDNNYYGFPFIRGDEMLRSSAGLIVRDDWLKELGMEIPETIDDMEAVLKAFREKKGAEVPLSMMYEPMLSSTNGIISAYGIGYNWYVEDGKAKFGQYEPAYKDFLTTMNRWYQEKLLDNNFAALDGKTVDANFLQGRSGITYGGGGSGVGKFMQAMQTKDPSFSCTGIANPTGKPGETPFSGNYSMPVTGRFASVTTSCKNVELAMRFLDYNYTEKGTMLNNFGIEGESYEMKDGYPAFTDLIVNNPEQPMSSMMANYCLSWTEGPFVQDKRYLEQYYSLDQQKNSLTNWMKSDAKEHKMPDVSIKEEERSDYSKIMNDINTYTKEMTLKFIMGSEPLDKFDSYIAEMKKLGMDKAIEMQNQALERYNNR